MSAAKNGIDGWIQPSYYTPDRRIRAEHEMLTIVRRRRLHVDMLTYTSQIILHRTLLL